MVTHNQGSEYENGGNLGGVVAGLLIGAAAGAAAMLLLAPQSGKATRLQIKEKGIELRDRTTGIVDDAVNQVRSSTSMLAAEGRQKVEEIKGQGQELLAEQLGRVSAAAQAGKKAVQSA